MAIETMMRDEVHHPDLSRAAALVTEPARGAMLSALLDGRAFTAGELARVAGVTAQTASSHLAKLVRARLLAVSPHGRHRYYRLRDERVAQVLEGLHVLAASFPATGPVDQRLRDARACYHHLAGAAGVRIFDSLAAHHWLCAGPDGVRFTDDGIGRMQSLGIEVDRSPHSAIRPCMDWSERRYHLAGPGANAILALLLARGWARRDPRGRAILFSADGRRRFEQAFPL